MSRPVTKADVMTTILAILAFVASLALVDGCSFKQRPWSRGELALAGASTLAAGWNYYESERMLDRAGTHEWNPAFGERPSDLKLGICMGLTQLTALAIAHWFPVVEIAGDEYELRVPLVFTKGMVNGALALHDRGVGN